MAAMVTRDALSVQKTLAEVKNVGFWQHEQKENTLFSRINFRSWNSAEMVFPFTESSIRVLYL
jgi:hypothetical protein